MPGTTELDPTLSALAAGQRVFDRFVLVRSLGRNRTGVSWLTQDDVVGRAATVRFLTEALVRDLVALADLKLEVNALGALRHPAFAGHYEFHQEDKLVAVSREFVPGAPLGALREVRLGGCFDTTELFSVIEPLGGAFRHAHDEAKLVHRGLHPGHLVLTPDNEIRVVDCGIAHVLFEARGRRDDGERDGPLSAYASPQLVSGHAPVPADDVRAFGAVLYDLLAGSAPKQADDGRWKTIAEARADTNRWGEDVPARWEKLLADCLAQDAALRPRRIGDLIDNLRPDTRASAVLPPPGPVPIDPVPPNAAPPEPLPAVPPEEPAEPVRSDEHSAILPKTSELKSPTEPAPIPPSEPEPPNADPPPVIRTTASTRPDLDTAHAVATQRSHFRGVLIALAVLGAAFFGLQTLSRRLLPPAIPETASPVPIARNKLQTVGQVESGTMTSSESEARAVVRDSEHASEPESPEPLELAQTVAPSTASEENGNAALVEETSIPSEPSSLPKPIEPVVTTSIPEPPFVLEPAMSEEPKPAVAPDDAEIATVTAPPEPLRAEPVQSSKPPKAGQRWVNSLGLPFVPVKGLPVLVCVWETRKRDLEAFAKATGTKWEESNDGSGPNYPAVNVSFLDATLFCEWLTTVEESAGKLTAGQRYRLPTDEEWSAAAGVSNEKGASPPERDDQADQSYPWGTSWPPPPTAGNYAGLNPSPADAADAPPGDLYPRTAPVGMFEPNQFGLFDMGGNVAEMVSDLIEPELGQHATRGGSYRDKDASVLRLRHREVGEDTRGRKPQIGFRVVLDPRVKR